MTDPVRGCEHRGGRLAYRVAGAGPPILFIQGVGVHGSGWRPQVDVLSVRYRCLWFDNRGVGGSQPRPAAITVAQMADDACAVMDAEGWSAAHVVGHSMGGLVALQMALQARSRVRSLSLLCTFASGRAATALSGRMLWIGLRTRIGSRRMRRHAFLELVMTPGELATVDRPAMAAALAPVFGHDLGDHEAMEMPHLSAMRGCDLTPRLGELAGLPVLAISAAHDIIAPPALGRSIAAGIPGSRYVEIADAAHGLPILRAERLNALLIDHLSACT